MTRDEIVKELNKEFAMLTDNGSGPLLLFKNHGSHFQLANIDHIADFILARERVLLDRVANPLEDVIRFNADCGKNIYQWKMVNEFEGRVQEALAIIEKERRG